MLPLNQRSLIWSFLYLVTAAGYAITSKCDANPYLKDSAPLVKTSSGSVLGKYFKVFDTDMASFLGIPFAEPPVGEKRFKRADSIKPWKGILDATQMPPPCMQYSSRNYSWIPKTKPSENCLYLNIWTPAKCCSCSLEKLPVIVWIYGGGFYSGSTDIDIYDGMLLASYGNAVVVSINYRVGVFGFLSTGIRDAEGNVGLYDQALALEWIQKNIKHFRGDSERITLMGESAGAISIGLHMISPVSKNLFQRAVIQSATPYHPQFIDDLPVSQFKALTFSNLVGCANTNESIETNWTDVVSCLRMKDAQALAEAEDVFTAKIPAFFLPSIGGDFLPKDPIEAFESGEIADVDILIGITKDEATIFLNYLMPDLFQLYKKPTLNLVSAKEIIKKLFETVPNPPADDIFNFYFKNLTDDDPINVVRAISNAYGDYVFNCPVLFLSETLPCVYAYWFTHRSLLDSTAEWVGVPHFTDVPYVFGVPMQDGQLYTPEDGRLSGNYIYKLVSFAKHGYPVEAKSKWPRFSSTYPVAYELNSKSESYSTFPRINECKFWKPYFKRL